VPISPFDTPIIPNTLSDIRALLVLNLADNNLGAIVGWTHHPNKNDNYKYEHTDGRHQKQLPEGEEMGKPEGVIAVANAIKDMRALSVLSLKSNALLNIESGKALAHALKGNLVLTELDVSANYDLHNANSRDGPGFAQELAVGIKDNGALSTVTIYKFPLPIQDIKTKIELNFSGKELCSLDAIVIAALLPLNVSGTQFGYPIIADIAFC
jgi:hypothetical protein